MYYYYIFLLYFWDNYLVYSISLFESNWNINTLQS